MVSGCGAQLDKSFVCTDRKRVDLASGEKRGSSVKVAAGPRNHL